MSKYLLRISFYLLPTFGCFIIGYLISEKEFDQKYTTVVPIGVGATKDFIHEVSNLIGRGDPFMDLSRLRFDWWSKSVDSTYFTGKRVFIFGDYMKNNIR